jgi:hypothetical protein
VLEQVLFSPSHLSACFLVIPAIFGLWAIVKGAKHIRCPDPESAVYAPVAICMLAACSLGPLTAVFLAFTQLIAAHWIGPAFALAGLVSPLVGLFAGAVAAAVLAIRERRPRGSA